MKKTALVISGGGCKGAFAVGAIKSIYERFRSQGWFSIVGGSSTGAMIAPLAALLAAPEPMASNAFTTMRYFYSHITTSSVLERKSIVGILQHQNSFNRSTPMRKLLNRLFIQKCFDWLRSEEAPHCYVVYVNYRSAQKVFVSPKDEKMTRDRFIDAMLASASVPVFVEPTIIDGDACYDGGLRDVIPFGNAIRLGAEAVVPIFLDPETMDQSDDDFKRIGKVVQRALFIMMDENRNNDHEIARLVNLADKVRMEVLESVGSSRRLRTRLERIFDREEYSDLFSGGKRLVKIIEGIRPDFTLTNEPLSFDPVLMKKWIALGAKKAREVLASSPFE